MGVYHVHGPFEIPTVKKGKKRLISRHLTRDFWDKIEGPSDLRDRKGCYLFAMRAGKGTRPWYVGMTTARFRSECFQDHKRKHFESVLEEYQRATPVMFFVVLEPRPGRQPTDEISEMEDYLISVALKKNPELCNVKGTRGVESWSISGVKGGGKGKPSTAAQEFSAAIGLRRGK